MHRVRAGKWGVIAAAAILIQAAAVQADAAAIYDYRGSEFTFCGFGCPEESPPNWEEDYLIASLTFNALLAPNLTFADDVRAGLVAFTVTDKLGTFFQAGTELPDFDDDGFTVPGLQLETDANGNIVKWAMATNLTTFTFSFNPPIFCEDCGGDIADIVAVNIGLPGDENEWDAGNGTPGEWSLRAEVPEPATLALSLIALGGFAVRRRKQFLARVGKSGVIAAAALLIPVAATQAEAAAIYDYQGTVFTLCGTGCPENSPPNWEEDYLIASLTFNAPLAPSLTFDDEVRTGLIEVVATNKFGSFLKTGNTLPDGEDDGMVVPGLKLATDANGNITAWIMSTEANDGKGDWLATNPPFVCPVEECGVELAFANYLAVRTGPGEDDWYDTLSETPGAWSLRTEEVPEPATFALSLIALGGFAVRQRRQFLARR
jgi:hypothetical protein